VHLSTWSLCYSKKEIRGIKGQARSDVLFTAMQMKLDCRHYTVKCFTLEDAMWLARWCLCVCVLHAAVQQQLPRLNQHGL